MIMSPDDISQNRRMALLWGSANIALIILAVCMMVFEKQVSAAISLVTGVDIA